MIYRRCSCGDPRQLSQISGGFWVRDLDTCRHPHTLWPACLAWGQGRAATWLLPAALCLPAGQPEPASCTLRMPPVRRREQTGARGCPSPARPLPALLDASTPVLVPGEQEPALPLPCTSALSPCPLFPLLLGGVKVNCEVSHCTSDFRAVPPRLGVAAEVKGAACMKLLFGS